MPFQKLGDWAGRYKTPPWTSARNVLGGEITSREIIIAGGDGVIRSQNFDGSTKGWAIKGDGSASFYGDIIVGADLYSSNWNGANPADLSSGADGTATAGYYFDHSAGSGQIEGSLYVGGSVELQDAGAFKTAASGRRIEMTAGEFDRIRFYTSGGDSALIQVVESTNDQLWIYGVGGTAPSIILTTGGSTFFGYPALSVQPIDMTFSTVRLRHNQSLSAPDLAGQTDPNTGLTWGGTAGTADSLSLVAGGVDIAQADSTSFKRTADFLELERTANQTISNNTFTNIDWQQEDSASGEGTNWDDIGGANPDRITVTEAGIYHIVFQARWASNSTGHRQLIIRKNGTVRALIREPASTFERRQVVRTIKLAANDYIECRVHQNSGGNLDIDSSQTYVTITRI